MNTKLIMTASALVLGAAGLVFTFAPEEILKILNIETSKLSQLLIQILGALYFGFAMMNWMARESAIGGIYNRPIAVANITHFSMAGLALIKGAFAMQGAPIGIWIVTGIYAIFAVVFGTLLFRHPMTEKKD